MVKSRSAKTFIILIKNINLMLLADIIINIENYTHIEYFGVKQKLFEMNMTFSFEV